MKKIRTLFLQMYEKIQLLNKNKYLSSDSYYWSMVNSFSGTEHIPFLLRLSPSSTKIVIYTRLLLGRGTNVKHILRRQVVKIDWKIFEYSDRTIRSVKKELQEEGFMFHCNNENYFINPFYHNCFSREQADKFNLLLDEFNKECQVGSDIELKSFLKEHKIL